MCVGVTCMQTIWSVWLHWVLLKGQQQWGCGLTGAEISSLIAGPCLQS